MKMLLPRKIYRLKNVEAAISSRKDNLKLHCDNSTIAVKQLVQKQKYQL